jgi:SAM-dependent methyltransferase
VTASSEQRSVALHLSGERTVPDVAEENYWFRRHEVVYAMLAAECADATVLEAGCGEGYGASLINAVARKVIALDYDSAATAHVRERYPDVSVVRGNLGFLPMRTASVDVIVNFQVIEHLWDQLGFLRECLRVLRPGGKLLVSTPNRITFSPGRDTPLNPYHTRELAPSEMDELLRSAGFAVSSMLGVRHGPSLRALDARYGGSIIDAQLDVVMNFLPGQAKWPAELLADVTAITAADFEITADSVDESLDIVAVGRRP